MALTAALQRGEYTMPAEVYCEGDERTYTVTSVKGRTFFQNQNIFKLTLPDTIEEVGERAFDQMFNVCEMNIPKNLKKVGYQAFGYLGWDGKSIGLEFNLDQVLEVPGTVEFWDDCAFAGNMHKAVVVGEGVEYIWQLWSLWTLECHLRDPPSTLKRINNCSPELLFPDQPGHS